MAGYFELKRGAKGGFRFNLKAGNHETILTSESYSTKAAAKGGIESVKRNAALSARFERRTAKDGSSYFVLVAANKEVIGMSEMYKATRSMENGIASVQKNAPDAEVRDKTE
jgi:uncharacterized protein YegP (UPF0339 family)